MITVIKVRYFIDGVGRNYLPEVSEKVFGSIANAREFYKTKFNSTIINLTYISWKSLQYQKQKCS